MSGVGTFSPRPAEGAEAGAFPKREVGRLKRGSNLEGPLTGTKANLGLQS